LAAALPEAVAAAAAAACALVFVDGAFDRAACG
jgi:hypothetical protein